MRFEFLAPDQAQEWEGATPLRRSPIEYSHRGSGARFSERAGWSVVAGYREAAREAASCRRAVGVADVSHLGKLELQGRAPDVAAIVAEIGAGGAALQSGSAVLHDGIWWCPLSPERVLALSPPEATGPLRERLEGAARSASSFAAVTELTAAMGSNAVLGPLAREAFARTTALDMRPQSFAEGAFAPVSVARTPGMVLREEGDFFIHVFGAGYADYVWTVFVDAAEQLGGGPVGAEALRAVRGVGGVGAGA
jgi:glycine cleavage system aminomethyltransferase T